MTSLSFPTDPNEQVWIPKEIAFRWKKGTDYVIRRFKREPGVIHFGIVRKGRRIYDPIGIPTHVLERLERQMMRGDAA